MAADVYAVPPHTGEELDLVHRLAAWMYRLIMNHFWCFAWKWTSFNITPCLPADWDGFKLHYRYLGTVFHISVIQTHSESAVMHVSLDGNEQ